jgi:hypothetical protein
LSVECLKKLLPKLRDSLGNFGKVELFQSWIKDKHSPNPRFFIYLKAQLTLYFGNSFRSAMYQISGEFVS